MLITKRVRIAIGLICLVALAAAGTSAALAGARGAARAHTAAPNVPANAADCQPYASQPCLLPFPNNLFTRRDRTSATGVRVHLPVTAMPVNTKGQRIGVAPYDRNDGFSPGSALIVHISGFDNAAAFHHTNPVQLSNMASAFAKKQPIVVIDEQTGKRQLIWSELDSNVPAPGRNPTPLTTNLLIHPGKNFTEGHTYAVALRSLRTSTGQIIRAPGWFERLRDQRKLLPAERSQQKRYGTIFKVLKKAKIGRSNLFEAWDFTVASRQNLTSRLLAIRNSAFAQLGDTNLADNTVQGSAPGFTVTSADMLNPQLRRVQGTFRVPCYLTKCGPTETTGFHYSSGKPDALPTQTPGNVATAQFECIIPTSATAHHLARISLYGHGLLGSRDEVEAGNVRDMATEKNMTFCATDWWGLASPDTAYDASVLGNLGGFENVVDRLQQGVLNTLFLGRVMLNPKGFATNPAFQTAGTPVIDTSHLYYDGNSQGGIEGGMTTAAAPDFRRAVLGVSGMNYGNVLVQRSVDFAPFGTIMIASYPDQSMYTLTLDLIQQLWDRGDPDGYAQQMTSHPLPDTPSHTVLMQIAYGDHQVSMYAAAVEARTIGARVHAPALDADRARDRNLFYGIKSIGRYPFGGNAIVIWDAGPGLVAPPPFGNNPPQESPSNQDPHEFPRSTPAARTQKSAFLLPHGSVLDVCGGMPCHTYNYTP
jgi:hypothetical protein